MTTTSPPPQDQPETIRILQVDDEPQMAELAATYLHRIEDRFEVDTATSAVDGLQHLADTDYDCIVSDYDMPGQNGIEFLEAVREQHPALPFILFTGKGSEAIASDAISAGVTDYLQKESGTDQYELLANRITNAVSSRRAERQLTEQRQRFRTLFERLSQPTVEVEYTDDDPIVKRVNPAFEELFGYEASAIVGESLDAHIVPDEYTDEAACINDHVQTDGHLAAAAVTRETVDGRREFLLQTAIYDDGSGGFVIYTDISERRAHERRLRRLIDSLPGMVYRCRNEPGWPLENLGGEVEALTGYEPDELEGRLELSEDILTHPDDQEAVWAAVQAAVDSREPFELTYRIRTKDGDTRWVWERGQAIYTEGGDVEAIEGFITDITERTEHRRELEETNAVLSTLFEALPVGVLAEDASGCVLAVNERFCDLFDVSGTPDELVGTDCDRLAEEVSDSCVDAEEFLERGVALVSAREPMDAEAVALGDGRTVERSYRPVELPDGGGHLWLYQDVTDRTEQLATIRDLQHRAQDLIRADTPEAAAATAVDIACETLGLSLSGIHMRDEDAAVLEPVAVTDAVEAHLDEPPRYHRTDPDRSVDRINWMVFETGEPLVIEDTRTDDRIDADETTTRSGIIYPLGDHGIFITSSAEPAAFDETDRYLTELLATMVTAVLDRTDREAELRTHQQRLQAERDRLDEFASVLSHDLRNPLNIAAGQLELAREEYESAHLEEVAAAHERIESLIETLLALAREGDAAGSFDPVALEPLVESCWEMVETGDATLVVDVEQTVRGDESRLRQLFENLLRNAVEHGSDGVMVTVGPLADGFYIEDDGPGIPEADRERIFDVGYSNMEEGTGFGLAIARQIVRAHGWELTVTEGEAGGARFEVTGVQGSP